MGHMNDFELRERGYNWEGSLERLSEGSDIYGDIYGTDRVLT